MRPIRLAVIFDQQILEGGGYQQALNAALLTRELPRELVDLLFFTNLKENIYALSSHGIKAQLIKLSLADKVKTYLRRVFSDSYLFKGIKKLERYSPFERHLVRAKVDLVYFLSPSCWGRDLEELNYITTVWDLCHRDDPEFPEVRWNRQLEGRDKNYKGLLPRATAIFVDSELGKKNVVHRYGIDEERVHIMPFQPAVATRSFANTDSQLASNIREKYGLDVPYIFYPAQFWAHKNHVYLLEGLRELEQRHGLRFGAIFCGGDQGNQSYVESYVQELKLEDRVKFAGFVENEEIRELYRQSIALVMPSYFGPTNLPPLEAFELGVPVLYSNKAGLRNQTGEAALLMDLNSPESMANHLKNLIEDDQLRSCMVQAGRNRLAHFASIDRVGVLRSVIEDFRWRRLTWE
jgi:glycosyltransferase involved in cell wall biosynthesis